MYFSFLDDVKFNTATNLVFIFSPIFLIAALCLLVIYLIGSCKELLERFIGQQEELYHKQQISKTHTLYL